MIIKSENFDNHLKYFREILRIISENIFGSVEILRIILNIFKKSLEISRVIAEDFDIYLFHKILRNILENFKKHFKRFGVKF